MPGFTARNIAATAAHTTRAERAADLLVAKISARHASASCGSEAGELFEAAHAAGLVEETLRLVLAEATGAQCPPRLAAAMHHAVFAGGGRLRPALACAVARACGGELDAFVLRHAVALELIHCAALVHDDMPCFDDAAERRGKPSVHVAYDEATALLVGDALIFAAIQAVTGVLSARPLEVAQRALSEVVLAGGSVRGLVAGQAWELEPRREESGPHRHQQSELARYHAQKTGALFEAACAVGALAAGANPDAFRQLGAGIGMLYQELDDALDSVGTAAEIGKPVRQDEAHGRPSAVAMYGVAEVAARLQRRMESIQTLLPADSAGMALRNLLDRTVGPMVALVQSRAQGAERAE
jgi:geranylgeranyl diphosphate synthase, type II